MSPLGVGANEHIFLCHLAAYFIDIQDITIPLFHLNFCDNLLPRCPVYQEDEDICVITEDSEGLSAVCHWLQHVAAENDVYLSMGDNTVQLVDKLYVVLKRVA